MTGCRVSAAAAHKFTRITAKMSLKELPEELCSHMATLLPRNDLLALDRRKQKGGRWDASRSPPLDDTVHCGRSRGYSPSSCDSISLDSSGRSEVAYKAPSRCCRGAKVRHSSAEERGRAIVISLPDQIRNI